MDMKKYFPWNVEAYEEIVVYLLKRPNKDGIHINTHLTCKHKISNMFYYIFLHCMSSLFAGPVAQSVERWTPSGERTRPG